MAGQAGQGKKARPGHRKVAQWTRDYERLPDTLAGLHFLAFAILLLKRFVVL